MMALVEPEINWVRKWSLRELYAAVDPYGWDARAGSPRIIPRSVADWHSVWALECQTVRECGAIRVPPWLKRWPWESKSARNVGAKRRKTHRGVVETPTLIRQPEKFLERFGLARIYLSPMYVTRKFVLIGGLSKVLEHIGLSEKQRAAFEIREGIHASRDMYGTDPRKDDPGPVPLTEVGAALGISHVAVMDRLGAAQQHLEGWRAAIPAVQPQPYKWPTSEEEARFLFWRLAYLKQKRRCMSMALIQLDDRRRSVGLSLAELARRSRIPYSRLWMALTDDRLNSTEILRVEHVIEQAEAEHCHFRAAV